jgi:hypothetical protein
MAASPEPPSWTVRAGAALAALLFAAAVAVRAIPGEGPLAPSDRPVAPDAVREPMQLLGRGASLRIAELDGRVGPERAAEWRAARRSVFELQGCPDTAVWLDGPEGQRVARVVGDLRRGTREEALAALALILELARRTDWDPGLLARTADAERLALLLQDWLRAWGERGADDPTLAEPAVTAVLAYARVARRACRAPPIGRIEAIYERARAFLASILADAQGQPTALSRALRARHPTAIEGFDSKQDCLAGFDRAFDQLDPALDGDCG